MQFVHCDHCDVNHSTISGEDWEIQLKGAFQISSKTKWLIETRKKKINWCLSELCEIVIWKGFFTFIYKIFTLVEKLSPNHVRYWWVPLIWKVACIISLCFKWSKMLQNKLSLWLVSQRLKGKERQGSRKKS